MNCVSGFTHKIVTHHHTSPDQQHVIGAMVKPQDLDVTMQLQKATDEAFPELLEALTTVQKSADAEENIMENNCR